MSWTEAPELCWHPDCYEVNFGAVSMPEGYTVWWHGEHEHFQGHGPGGWESVITVSKFQARDFCVTHKRKQDME